MNYLDCPSAAEWNEKLKRPVFDFASLDAQVKPVMEAVKSSGDAALREFSKKFDGVDISVFELAPEKISSSGESLSPALRGAMQAAARNIHKFHEAQKTNLLSLEVMPGVRCMRKPVPIRRVGLYIPGGSAPLFSTMLMLGIPARIAGCEEVIVCSPPQKDGTIHPAILYAAHLSGSCRVFAVGGAQAIAAMAYGTESVPRVSKIFGPGNQYVTCAKQLVAREGMAIDIPAGPSELAVFADETVNPAFVAADLLSQAEHGPDSQVVLVALTEKILKEVMQEIEKQLTDLPRRDIAERALKNSFAVRLASRKDAIALLDDYAPEHLIFACEDADEMAFEISNAGSVFIGQWSPESVGDYASGTNHTLPTNGAAKGWSGVSLDSFVKKITYQKLSAEGLQLIGPHVEILAAAEGLDAHRNAVSLRLNELSKK